MIKTLTNLLKQDKEKFVVPKGVQDCIPILDDLTTRDQRMMFAVLTLVHTADSKKQLDDDTEALLTVARQNLCQFAVLKYQQPDGLNTAMPFGTRKIDAFRTLTTESLAVFIPFPVAEMKKGMALQNSLVKALEQEGFMSGKKYNDTAQIKFEHSENAILENICNKHGFEIEHPQVNMKVEHLDTAVYKKKKEIESLEIEKLDLQDEVEYLTSEKEEITHNISKYKKQRDLLYSFISKVLVCFLPEKVIDYIFDVIGKNTWTEVETSIQAEIDMLEHQNDKDITDDI